MRLSRLPLAVGAALFLGLSPAQAQKEKQPGLPPGDLFFVMKGQPFALERVFPGVQGALLLTDAQKQRLFKALEETTWSETIRSAGRTFKADPNATAAQKEEARKVIQEARTRLQQQVAGLLTQEQKTLIDRLNAAAAEAHLAAREKLEAEFTAAKGDKTRLEEVNEKMREEAQAEFNRKLPGLLTAEQRQGLEKAAQQQKAAGAKKEK
jgi:Spy/CpxP family protein refolding chaperone